MLAGRAFDAPGVFDSFSAFDAHVYRNAPTRRGVPAKRLSPSESHRHQRIYGCAMWVGWHTPRVIHPLAPLWRAGGLVSDHGAVPATLRGQVVADAIRSIHCGCVEQHDGRDR